MSDVVTIATDGDAADIALARSVATELERLYPAHLWLVGANHQAGTVTIDLPYEKPHHLRNYGMLLHITSLADEVSWRKVMRAGGELLERFGLARAKATPDSRFAAKEHGLDTSHAIIKSKH